MLISECRGFNRGKARSALSRRLERHMKEIWWWAQMEFTARCAQRCGHLPILQSWAGSPYESTRVCLSSRLEDQRLIISRLGLTVEYSCIFGISSAVTGLEVGEQVACFHDGFTIMTYQGLGGRVYWFVVEKLDRKYTYPHLPRFSQQDALNGCERLGGVWLRNTVHFRDVWANRETFAMTALEECVLRPWHSGRIVCIGDSIHKVRTPL
jgi:hypothetical protein